MYQGFSTFQQLLIQDKKQGLPEQSLFFCKQKIFEKKKRDSLSTVSFVLALPIFPARLQASIFGVNELNFRVRNGNGWTLVTINTNSLS